MILGMIAGTWAGGLFTVYQGRRHNGYSRPVSLGVALIWPFLVAYGLLYDWLHI